MNKKYIILGVIIIIITAILFYIIGYSSGRKDVESEIDYYKEVIDEYSIPIDKETFSISGKITEIQDNALSIETTIFDPYKLFKDQKPEIRKIIVTNETKIVKRETPADPFGKIKDTEISLSDLEIENWIYAESGENIKNKKEFTAKSIILTEQLPSGTTSLSPEDESAPTPREDIPPLPEEYKPGE